MPLLNLSNYCFVSCFTKQQRCLCVFACLYCIRLWFESPTQKKLTHPVRVCKCINNLPNKCILECTCVTQISCDVRALHGACTMYNTGRCQAQQMFYCVTPNKWWFTICCFRAIVHCARSLTCSLACRFVLLFSLANNRRYVILSQKNRQKEIWENKEHHTAAHNCT